MKVTLLRKNKTLTSKTRHQSIVIYLNDPHTANNCIKNGLYINYLHYYAVRFMPQFQIGQCLNCYEYGHHAANCKHDPRCGKCGEKHNTKECNSTTVMCTQCKGPHEAWHHNCPARIAERYRLAELKEHSPHLFKA